MKNLNALVIAIAVPTFFASVGGMSEFSNVIGLSKWKYGYSIFVVAMVVLAFVTFTVIKKSENFWNEERGR